jgi:hypothetical protein
MSEYYVLVKVKIKDGILSSQEIEKAKKELPKDYLAQGDSAITLSKKYADIVFKCTKTSTPVAEKSVKKAVKKSSPKASKTPVKK